MKTPFDSALRVQARAMDAIRLSLFAEVAKEFAIEAEREVLAASMRREAAIAASNWQVTAHPYGQYQRAERRRLDADHRGIKASLGTLRDAAMDACGQMQAITDAATGFTTGQHQREANAEQAHADDFAGTRIAGHRRQLSNARR